MSLAIDLPEPVEARLEEEAQKAGLTPAQLAAEFVTRNLAPAIDAEKQKQLNDPSIALLQRWLAESETADPEEIRQAEEDLREFKRNLNAPRKQAGARLLFPDVESEE
jgi:aryl-alcohol dehydrogenase-like predicted oxidoreductase